MDATTIQILIGAISPIALLIVGAWIKRSGDERAERLIAASAAAKIAADGSAALARENLAKSVEIAKKVDGNTTQMLDDLKAARAEVAEVKASSAAFQGMVSQMLKHETKDNGEPLESVKTVLAASPTVAAAAEPTSRSAMSVNYPPEKG